MKRNGGNCALCKQPHGGEGGFRERKSRMYQREHSSALGQDSERWAGLTEPPGGSMVNAPGSGKENQITSLKGYE